MYSKEKIIWNKQKINRQNRYNFALLLVIIVQISACLLCGRLDRGFSSIIILYTLRSYNAYHITSSPLLPAIQQSTFSLAWTHSNIKYQHLHSPDAITTNTAPEHNLPYTQHCASLAQDCARELQGTQHQNTIYYIHSIAHLYSIVSFSLFLLHRQSMLFPSVFCPCTTPYKCCYEFPIYCICIVYA